MNKQAPYGTWASPITGELVARLKHTGFSQLTTTAQGIYWIKSRPLEKGRRVIMRYANDTLTEMTPAGFNVRTRAHEYGGGDFWIHNNTLYFINDDDQRIYAQSTDNQPPQPITPASETKHALRYADGIVTQDGKCIICVSEKHHNNNVVNSLVAIQTDGTQIETIAEGADFYSSPKLSPDGKQLAWLCWNHPQMPWDGTELWLADVTFDHQVIMSDKQKIAGGPNESIYQPEWRKDNVLHFVSDKSGWWNIYNYNDQAITPVSPMSAEYGAPHWIFGTNTYTFLENDHIACIVTDRGTKHIAMINPHTQSHTFLKLPWDEFSCNLHADDYNLYFTASNFETMPSLVRLDIKTKKYTIIKSEILAVDQDYISRPRAIEFETDNKKTAYAFYYPPCNKNYTAQKDERPPLLVISHGGPTAATSTALNFDIQFWTSRGFAVVDVNYRGSTGYGRAYRNALKEQWGIADVADCTNAAKYLIQHNEVDPKRIAIRGRSAGGYTTLCALTFYNIFTAGASYYGVSDLKMLVEDTHKFEAHYLDSLIGPYPEKKEIYEQRSPINFADQLSCPIIFFQGLEDKVVPPAQAETMIAALKKKGLPYTYITFDHEQHGFRDAKNIQAALEAELSFYTAIF